MPSSRVLGTLAVGFAITAVLSCSTPPQRPVETTNATSTPTASPEIGRVQKAKALIDENIQKAMPVIEKIESAGKDKKSLQSMRESIIAELEPLAIKEAEMYLSMTPAERLEVHEYMLSRLSAYKTGSPEVLSANSSNKQITNDNRTAKDRFFDALESINVEVNRAAPSKESFNDPPSSNRPAAFQDLGPRRANCIGWFVGHRRCCANNAGNGVCGGAPIDCYGSNKLISDSCPQCNWCQY